MFFRVLTLTTAFFISIAAKADTSAVTLQTGSFGSGNCTLVVTENPEGYVEDIAYKVDVVVDGKEVKGLLIYKNTLNSEEFLQNINRGSIFLDKSRKVGIAGEMQDDVTILVDSDYNYVHLLLVHEYGLISVREKKYECEL